METRVVTDAAALGEYAEAWRRLERTDEGFPHQSTFDYVSAWAGALPAGWELRTVVAEDHHELVGVLPLALAKRRVGPVGWRELVFVAEGDRRDVILDTQRVAASTTIKALLAAALGPAEAHRINLRYLPADSALTAYFLRSGEFNRHLRPLVEIPILHLDAFDDFTDWRRTVPRSSLTALNKLRREVGLVTAEIRPVDADLFDELTALHLREKQILSRERGRRERHSLFEDPRRHAVYRALTVGSPHACAFTARGKDGMLLFYELAWRRGRRIWTWSTAYEPDLDRHRPSRARIAVLESLFESGDTAFYDLGAGRYPWKFELTSAFEQCYELSRWTSDDPRSRVLSKVRP